MKNLIILTLSVFLSLTLSAQTEIEKSITEAQGYLKTKNYKDAQIALQQAISQIYEMLGKDLLTSLPVDLIDMKANIEEDVNNTGGMGMTGGGFTISRNYYQTINKETNLRVNIVANSPMISSISMMINNPMLLGSNPDAGKSIKIGNRRSLFKPNTKEKSYELTVPLTNSLVTINGYNIKDEATFLALVTKLDVEKIAKVLSE
ncbi:MAG: hypothetical protein ABIR66_09295 [Saprospiraceae bacterium]